MVTERETCTRRLRTHHKPEGTPCVGIKQHTYSLRAHHRLEGTPYVSKNNPNPRLRAHHMPEGTPCASSIYPNPNLRKDSTQMVENTPNDVQHGETGKEYTEGQKENIRQEKNYNIRKEGDCSPAELQGDSATSRLGAKRRRKRWGKGDGKWVENMYTQAHLHKYFAEHCRNEWDGKPALAQDRTPSRGEPGEPRRFETYQWTPSPKLGGKEDKMEGNDARRKRNYKRGIRNEATIEKNKITETSTGGSTDEYTEKSEEKPPGETGGGWPPKPDESHTTP